jgi:hypothetical protein
MSGWLDDVLGAYLDTVGEREFDAAFLALLKAAGYTNVHLVHGSFEFGKDFIAQREGVQFGLQTKAGDINLGAWRTIRSQIEEILWNDIAHPDFDTTAERRAVLVTTGRLVGGAAADAQQYRETLARRTTVTAGRPPPFEVWDREGLLALMELSPEISLNGWSEEPLLELLGLLADASRRQLTSRTIERSTRSWLGRDLTRAALATALAGNRLLETTRPDLATSVAAGLLRAAACELHGGDSIDGMTALNAGRRLYDVYSSTLVDTLAPVSGDPAELFHIGNEVLGGVSYPVRCSLMIESIGLLGLLRSVEGDEDAARALATSLEQFVLVQPGAAHPISDRWAASLVPPAILLRRVGSGALEKWLEDIVVWICDHHYRAPGLASVYAEPSDEVRYLLGEPFEHVVVPRRHSSYLATVVLDLACTLELPGLFRDAFNDFAAVNLALPAIEPLDEPGQYLFDGSGLTSEANVAYDEDHDFATSWQAAVHHRRAPSTYQLQRAGRSWDLLAIATVLRDRHFLSVTRELASAPLKIRSGEVRH